MLNYNIHTGEKDIELLEAEVRGVGIDGNPFPGLRPFGIEECHLFFGREGQVDDVLGKLSNNRFVAIMGFSGGGKSSLMYCGLIPVLYGGFMSHAGPNWNVVVSRPGIAPIDNLAESILQKDQDYLSLPEGDRIIQHTVTSSILRSGVKGLVDLAKNLQDEKGDNLLILIDQFEELFRYREGAADPTSSNESALFINMLLEAIKQEDVPIFLAITMRSEFIGECAKYPGLTEMINTSNYLVPQMTREQKRMAIEGPVAVGGGRISPRLVKRLLNDVGEQQDQLPVLQHALMRTWNYWTDNKEKEEPMDLRHYNAIGKISEALSQHANEAFDELSEKQRRICEVLFKTVTEKSSDNIGVRRPTRLVEIAEIAGVDEEEVIEVIDHFRETGRSLLMPAAHIPLDSESIIEISHESLIRIWTRLKNWVEEEYESAQMYRRLSDAAAMYQIGRTGLWRPPDLQLALNWQKKQNPSRIWAKRYDEAFERAIVFLDTSRITYEAEQKNQEMMQKRLLKRARVVALSLGIAAVILIIFFIFAVIQRLDAENNAREARVQESLARDATTVAIQQRDIAAAANREAYKNLVRSKVAAQKALANQFYANYQANQALAAERRAVEAQRQTLVALASEKDARAFAEDQRQIAEAKTREVEQLLHLSAAQSMSVKAVNLVDTQLKGLLAQQAYLFNTQYLGNPLDPYIYDGLYQAMNSFEGDAYNEFFGHNDAIKSIAFAHEGYSFFSAGSDGTLRIWDTENPENNKVIYQNGTHPNRTVKVSPDGKWVALGSDSTALKLFNIETGEEKTVTGNQSFIYDIEFTADNSGLYTLSHDRSIRFYDNSRLTMVKRLQTPLKTFDLSSDHSFAIGGSKAGQVIHVDLGSGTETLIANVGVPVHSVDISPDDQYLLFGDEAGIAHVIDLSDNSEINTLRGHTSRINVVSFSHSGKLLATGSYDGSVQLYAMADLDDLPIVMKDHGDFVWDLSFSSDDAFLITGANNGTLKLWPTRADYFAKDMCEKITRNIEMQEWDRYVPEGITYRVTCENANTGAGGE